jgi:hypothetical protein
MEYVRLWSALSHIQLHPNKQDSINWNFKQDGKFITGSTYHAQFVGATQTNFKQLI